MRLIPIEPEGRRGAEGPQPHSTPKKKAKPLASVLTEQVKTVTITGTSASPVCSSD